MLIANFFVNYYLNNVFCLFYVGLALPVHPPSGDDSPCEKRIKETMNAKCRETRYKNFHLLKGKDRRKVEEDKEGS